MVENKESSSMANILNGEMLQQEFLKDQFLFLSVLNIYDFSDNLVSNL